MKHYKQGESCCYPYQDEAKLPLATERENVFLKLRWHLAAEISELKTGPLRSEAFDLSSTLRECFESIFERKPKFSYAQRFWHVAHIFEQLYAAIEIAQPRNRQQKNNPRQAVICRQVEEELSKLKEGLLDKETADQLSRVVRTVKLDIATDLNEVRRLLRSSADSALRPLAQTVLKLFGDISKFFSEYDSVALAAVFSRMEISLKDVGRVKQDATRVCSFLNQRSTEQLGSDKRTKDILNGTSEPIRKLINGIVVFQEKHWAAFCEVWDRYKLVSSYVDLLKLLKDENLQANAGFVLANARHRSFNWELTDDDDLYSIEHQLKHLIACRKIAESSRNESVNQSIEKARVKVEATPIMIRMQAAASILYEMLKTCSSLNDETCQTLSEFCDLDPILPEIVYAAVKLKTWSGETAHLILRISEQADRIQALENYRDILGSAVGDHATMAFVFTKFHEQNGGRYKVSPTILNSASPQLVELLRASTLREITKLVDALKLKHHEEVDRLDQARQAAFVCRAQTCHRVTTHLNPNKLWQVLEFYQPLLMQFEYLQSPEIWAWVSTLIANKWSVPGGSGLGNRPHSL